MEKQLLDLGTKIVAAVIVMIVHEFPKTIVYYKMDQDSSKRSLKNALRVQHYIDPIGLIFCIATSGGFSKPYMYRIKDKKLNKALGITGYLSLALVYSFSVLALKFIFGVTSINGAFQYASTIGIIGIILTHLCFNLAFISFGMFLVNLFPIATFDMGNIIAGVSPMKFFEYLRKDYFMKVILVFVLMFGFTSSIGEIALSILLG